MTVTTTTPESSSEPAPAYTPDSAPPYETEIPLPPSPQPGFLHYRSLLADEDETPPAPSTHLPSTGIPITTYYRSLLTNSSPFASDRTPPPFPHSASLPPDGIRISTYYRSLLADELPPAPPAPKTVEALPQPSTSTRDSTSKEQRRRKRSGCQTFNLAVAVFMLCIIVGCAGYGIHCSEENVRKMGAEAREKYAGRDAEFKAMKEGMGRGFVDAEDRRSVQC